MTQKSSSSKSKKSGSRSLRLIQDTGQSAKPKVIRRPKNHKPAQENSKEDIVMEREEIAQEEVVRTESHETKIDNQVPGNESVDGPQNSQTLPQNPTQPAPALPSIAGFDLSGMSISQQYAIRNAVVLCDCSVQKTPELIFDVLARNFADTGALMWWLRRMGKGHLAESIKGKDVVDAVRKTAHALSRELREQIGKPMVRW
jgi:hypothetical protein